MRIIGHVMSQSILAFLALTITIIFHVPNFDRIIFEHGKDIDLTDRTNIRK